MFFGFTVGVAVGFALAVWKAPQSGAETRQQLLELRTRWIDPLLPRDEIAPDFLDAPISPPEPAVSEDVAAENVSE